jgi:hypothetical protein
MKPRGTQYLIYQALTSLMLIRLDTFDTDTGIWHIWVLSPVTNIAKILPNGSIELMEYEL